MKTMKIYLTIAMMSFFLCSIASNPQMQEIIQKHITYPEFAAKENIEGIVLVNISVNDNGNITVKEMNSNNELLMNSIAMQLMNIQVHDSAFINTEHCLRFNFRLL
jgi:outer membrane biosynthesis protein TonB